MLTSFAQDRYGSTPLHYACAQLNPIIVQVLLKRERAAATLRDAAGLEPAVYVAGEASTDDAAAVEAAKSKVLDMLKAAGSKSAAKSAAELVNALRDVDERAQRHVKQVARREGNLKRAERVTSSVATNSKSAATAHSGASKQKGGEQPMATETNAAELLEQMPSPHLASTQTLVMSPRSHG